MHSGTPMKNDFLKITIFTNFLLKSLVAQNNNYLVSGLNCNQAGNIYHHELLDAYTHGDCQRDFTRGLCHCTGKHHIPTSGEWRDGQKGQGAEEGNSQVARREIARKQVERERYFLLLHLPGLRPELPLLRSLEEKRKET